MVLVLGIWQIKEFLVGEPPCRRFTELRRCGDTPGALPTVHQRDASVADYYPLLAKAIAGLEKHTGDARPLLYERARTAMIGQLRNMRPPLTESEITRERLALEEAIRKVEAEAARRLHMEPPRADSLSTVRPSESQPMTERPPEPPQTNRNRLFGGRPPFTDEGLRGFRDVVADAETLGVRAAAFELRPTQRTNDPLAELARLIGQEDSFTSHQSPTASVDESPA